MCQHGYAVIVFKIIFVSIIDLVFSTQPLNGRDLQRDCEGQSEQTVSRAIANGMLRGKAAAMRLHGVCTSLTSSQHTKPLVYQRTLARRSGELEGYRRECNATPLT
jgi:hypothetical protein